ncbi:MAG: hypothetical protein WCJ30_06135, partial [Deltaproteobacteria bacterium]
MAPRSRPCSPAEHARRTARRAARDPAGWLLALGAAGCTANPGTGTVPAVRFSITAAGVGETNTRPLEPLRVGSRFAHTETIDTRFDLPWGSRRFVRTADGFVEAIESHGLLYRSNRADSVRLRYRRTSEGVVEYRASARSSTATLVVPNTVRFGMEWQTGADLAVTCRVVAHETMRTPLGDASVWKITRNTSAPLYYAEGIGYIGTGTTPQSEWLYDTIAL